MTSTEELVEAEKEVLENYSAIGSKSTELVPSVIKADVFWTLH